MALFENIINSLKKSMGGTKEAPGASKPDPDKKQEGEDDDELVETTEVIKALTEEVEAVKNGQAELIKTIQQISQSNAEDAAFKKSLGEGMIALLQGQEEIAKTPLPRRGIGELESAALAKGNHTGAPGAPVQRHRQFTPQDLDRAKSILCKAVADKTLSVMDASKAETQINKSIKNPAFQIDPQFITLLCGGTQG